MCCSPWGHKELDTTEQLNWTQLWGEASGLTEVIPLICTSAIRESPWTEETGRLQSMGSQRVHHDWATKHTCLFSYLRPVSRVLTSWVFSGLTIGSGCSLMVSEMAAILLPEFPGAYQLTIKWLLQSLMTVASFVYRYGRKYSISYLLLPRSLNPDPWKQWTWPGFRASGKNFQSLRQPEKWWIEKSTPDGFSIRLKVIHKQ